MCYNTKKSVITRKDQVKIMKKILVVSVLLLLVLFPTTNKIETEVANYYVGNQEDAKRVIVKSIFDNEELDINRKKIKDEDDFILYMKGVLKEIKKIVSKDTITKDDKEVLSKTFKDIADFVFYKKEIKGYKFKDLSITSKKEILKTYKEVDEKIESKYPNYKKYLETISKNQYNSTKKKANRMLENYKEQIKTETYNTAKKESKSIISKINNKINDWIKKVSE